MSPLRTLSPRRRPIPTSWSWAVAQKSNITECPGEWDNYQGVTDTEIRFGSSLPRSGALAGFGTISDGVQLYFDHVGPIDGRNVVMVSRDDGYVPARTLTNVEEMIDVENLMGFAGILGSPNNLAVQDLLNENCIPQLLNLTGLPEWGDPNNYPWTTGALMSYETEARIWCDHVADEFGSGATVAILSLGNDAGEAWRVAFNECAPGLGLDVVDEVQHDPQADSVGADVINLAASDADVLAGGLFRGVLSSGGGHGVQHCVGSARAGGQRVPAHRPVLGAHWAAGQRDPLGEHPERPV